VKLGEQDHLTWALMGHILWKKGDYQGAKNSFEESLKKVTKRTQIVIGFGAEKQQRSQSILVYGASEHWRVGRRQESQC
jgi:hypothetical protein